ncbi:hypothetical protein TYRP_023189 [Tyrophagus putrescentiae]|nr:hypothetical protein TYRP_023189 [Tyrophagus putrescentiae]
MRERKSTKKAQNGQFGQFPSTSATPISGQRASVEGGQGTSMCSLSSVCRRELLYSGSGTTTLTLGISPLKGESVLAG